MGDVNRNHHKKLDHRIGINILIPALLLVAASLAPCMPATAQQSSGSISGVVQDGQGGVIPGAKVVIINQAQGAVVRELTTSADGTFAVTPLIPAIYTVEVEIPGFKKHLKKDITLFAQDRIGLPPIVLELGAPSETVTVESNSVVLQTVSAERSGVITGSQITELGSLTRNFTDFLRTVPGFNSDTNNANGLRSDQNAITLDGVSMMDTGANSSANWRVNTDVIAEFKVLTSGQQAEFGRAAGANITLVSRGGTRDFHGGAYMFIRNEWMNANSFLNNYNHLPRARNRNRTQGFQVGGPIFIPGKFNGNRDKLFFFVNFEWQRPRVFSDLGNRLMPTEAERNGDFSATQENGKPVYIKNPNLTGVCSATDKTACFPGNKIPQNRWNAYGVQLFKLLPMPNSLGVDPTYNYQYQYQPSNLYNDYAWRFDYNISNSWRFFFRMLSNQRTAYQEWAVQAFNNLGWADSPMFLDNGALAVSGNLTTIISPTMTNEFNYGKSTNWLPNEPVEGSRFYRKNSGITLPLLDNDPSGLVPNLTFDVPNAPSLALSGVPYQNENPTVNWTDNIAKVFSKHTVKAGIFIEISAKRQTAGTIHNGRLNFSRDTANPGDTGWAYSNLLLGNYLSFDQAGNYVMGHYRSKSFEWYAQDNWRVARNLTLDYGMRFSIIQPMNDDNDAIAGFYLNKFDPKQQVVLYQPTLLGGKRIALNPITGQTAPATLIGAIVPGYGDPYNGLRKAGQDGSPRGLIEGRGVQYGPRFGLAWTPFGPASKTVIRLAGGVFYERIQGNIVFGQTTFPPITVTPKMYYGNLNDIQKSPGTLFPLASGGLSLEGKLPTVYSFNLSLQKELPGSVMLDVGYMGTVSRHLAARYPFNEALFGSAWLPQNQDPTKTPVNLNGDNALPVDFLRPYVGHVGSAGASSYGSGFIGTFGGSASYNALQISLNRRMTRDLQAGLTYSWSKALGTSSSIAELGHPLDTRVANYGWLSFDRTQVLTFNYIYNLPGGARKGSFLDHPLGRIFLNNWQVSGITSFSSGAPATISYGIQGMGSAQLYRRITGNEGWAPRPVLTGDINKSGGDRTLESWIDTSVIRPAVKGSTGMDSALRPLRGPGVNNWDISIFKKVLLGSSEQRYLQFRLEMYNAFNHTQPSAVATSAQFDSTGKLTNLPTSLGGGGGRLGFGAVNAFRNPRQMQAAVKFYF